MSNTQEIRARSASKAYSKEFKTFDFTGVWKDVMGCPEKNGIWIIYGLDKNGKTWFALKLAEYLSTLEKVLYVSAEEGMRMSFVSTMRRVGISDKNKALKFLEYISVSDLEEKLSKRRSPNIVFIDNITFYEEELKNGVIKKLQRKYPNKLFIYLAHEEESKPEPLRATAKMAKRAADIIVRVQGLMCFVWGRCPGGTLTIDYEQASLFHSEESASKSIIKSS